MLEVEILVDLYTDINIAKQKLEVYACPKVQKVVDYYYYDPLRENLKPNKDNKIMECCRIREKGGNCYITYKEDHYNGPVWSHSDEYEMTCSDIEIAKKIFEKIGLKELIIIDNTKSVFNINNYELVLEEVKELGNFLEVEYKSVVEYDSIEMIKDEIRIFIMQLGLEIGDELNSGKPELMLMKCSPKS